MTSDSFDQRLQRLVAAMAGEGTVDLNEYAQLCDHLERWVRNAYPALRDDAEDVAADAMASLVSAAVSGTEVARPGAYLTTSARNRAIDWLRRSRLHERQRDAGFDRPTAEVDSEVVDRLVSGDEVRAALNAALGWRRADDRLGDMLAVRVLATYLDLAGSGSPSTRSVATAAGTRHVTVLRVYAQVRAFLSDPESGWVPRSALRST